MVSCLGIMGAKSAVPSLRVPCVQSIDAIFSITKGSVCLGASSGIQRQSYETLGHGSSRGTSFIHLGFVVAEMQGFKIGTFIMKHGVFSHRIVHWVYNLTMANKQGRNM